MSAGRGQAGGGPPPSCQKIFIQRDYSEGTVVKFQTQFPPELESRVCIQKIYLSFFLFIKQIIGKYKYIYIFCLIIIANEIFLFLTLFLWLNIQNFLIYLILILYLHIL